MCQGTLAGPEVEPPGEEPVEASPALLRVEKVFPNLVVEKADGFKRVRYGMELQMQMIQALIELNQKVDSLQARLCELDSNQPAKSRNRWFHASTGGVYTGVCVGHDQDSRG